LSKFSPALGLAMASYLSATVVLAGANVIDVSETISIVKLYTRLHSNLYKREDRNRKKKGIRLSILISLDVIPTPGCKSPFQTNYSTQMPLVDNTRLSFRFVARHLANHGAVASPYWIRGQTNWRSFVSCLTFTFFCWSQLKIEDEWHLALLGLRRMRKRCFGLRWQVRGRRSQPQGRKN